MMIINHFVLEEILHKLVRKSHDSFLIMELEIRRQLMCH